jgi:Ca2+-binding EF-hand superfamily protein
MFMQADKDNTGKLNYQEFKDAFQHLTYGLNENDVNMHISMADEDENEMIDWKEFLPIGIRIIRTI